MLAPDYYVGEVAEELFSGMSSNLFERVRELKSLAYFVRASRLSGMQTGMFYFYSGTESRSAMARCWRNSPWRSRGCSPGGATEEELRRCQTRLKAGKRMAMQTNSVARHAGRAQRGLRPASE